MGGCQTNAYYCSRTYCENKAVYSTRRKAACSDFQVHTENETDKAQIKTTTAFLARLITNRAVKRTWCATILTVSTNKTLGYCNWVDARTSNYKLEIDVYKYTGDKEESLLRWCIDSDKAIMDRRLRGEDIKIAFTS